MTKKEKFEQASRFSKFARNWAYHAFFNGGFAHVDLHSGNIFYDLSQANPKGKQTLLDFGSTITVRPTTAGSFIRLLLAAPSNDLNLTLRALRDDMDLSKEQELSLKQNLETLLKKPELSAQVKTGLILNEVQSQGLPIAKELVHLLRGHLFLAEHIKTFNSELEVLDPNHSLGRFSLKTIYARSGLRGFVKDFYRFIIRDPNHTLTPDLVGRIAKKVTKDVVQSTESKFQVLRDKHCAGLLGLLTRSIKTD
jgi:predicted unusual protein kinase regulating ubiquinone biosynthesis (AarF/ABC1/UbiB family)